MAHPYQRSSATPPTKTNATRPVSAKILVRNPKQDSRATLVATENTQRVARSGVLATVILEKLPEGDVESAKYQYLSLHFHPRCGSYPEAYTGSSVTCEGCDYRIEAPNGEPLHVTLSRSEFERKIDWAAWFV